MIRPPSGVEVRQPVSGDLPDIRRILEQWDTDPATGVTSVEEVDEDQALIAAGIAGENPQQYLVAAREGTVIGIMGTQEPAEKMLEYAETEKPVELVFALVLDEERGSGIGRLLVKNLIMRARREGAEEVIVNSSRRYEKTGWPFWRRLFGEPVDLIPGYSERGGDALVWRKALNGGSPTANVSPTNSGIPRGQGESQEDYETRTRFGGRGRATELSS